MTLIRQPRQEKTKQIPVLASVCSKNPNHSTNHVASNQSIRSVVFLYRHFVPPHAIIAAHCDFVLVLSALISGNGPSQCEGGNWIVSFAPRMKNVCSWLKI